jgi:hypothetical protein
MAEPKLVTVYVSQGMLPAQVAQGKLVSAGIPVLLKYEAIGQIINMRLMPNSFCKRRMRKQTVSLKMTFLQPNEAILSDGRDGVRI